MSSTVIAKIPEEGGGPEEREGEIRWRNRVEGAEKKRGRGRGRWRGEKLCKLLMMMMISVRWWWCYHVDLTCPSIISKADRPAPLAS